MSFFPFIPPTGNASVTQTADPVTASGATEYTFSSASLGTAAGNRKIVIAVVGSDSSRTVSTLTVAGSGASFVVRQQHSSKTVELWQIELTVGTSGDIVVTWDSAQSAGCGIGVFAVYGAAAAKHDSGGGNGDGAGAAASFALDIPSGGVAIAAIITASAVTTTWAGVTEDYDETLVGSNNHSGGSAAFEATQTNLTISATPSGSTTHLALTTASWGPN